MKVRRWAVRPTVDAMRITDMERPMGDRQYIDIEHRGQVIDDVDLKIRQSVDAWLEERAPRMDDPSPHEMANALIGWVRDDLDRDDIGRPRITKALRAVVR
jgi:hypothetical protein